jgi:pyruvate dehydrogenase E2 component (dihydrolipoyllysine-residue acetyltransferase)
VMEPQTTAGRLVEWSRMRSAIARRMSASKRDVPHIYLSTEVAMTSVEQLRRSAAGVSVTAVLVHATAAVLQEHPRLNAVWTSDGLMEVDAINLGVAVALADGLVAPALLDCGSMSLPAVSAALTDLVERARGGRLRTDELAHATFTISNLGMFPVTTFSAIVNPPQVAILAAGAAVSRVVESGDAIRSVPTMTITLSADHRAVDGADCARFLAALKERLETPDNARKESPK